MRERQKRDVNAPSEKFSRKVAKGTMSPANKGKGKGKGFAWITRALAYEGDKCRLWPMSTDRHGYGCFGYLGKHYYAHQYICEAVNGPRPSPKHQAAHSCGRGHEGCCTPRHLSWKTNAENQLDRRRHGTEKTNRFGCRTRRTPQQNDEIRRAIGSDTVTNLAKRFGVSRRTIERIRAGAQFKPPGTSSSAIRRHALRAAQ